MTNCPCYHSIVRFAALILIPFAVGCAQKEPRVGKTWLIEADGTVEAAPGPAVELPGGTIPTDVKGPVQLAIGADVPWRDVVSAMKTITDGGGQPVLLVARRDRAEALPPIVFEEKPPEPDDAIRLRAQTDGKACVSPPGTEEATCVARRDHIHIDRAFVRQILWQAVKEYRLHKVRVVIPSDSLTWADVVRSIDGARTCCGSDVEITVTVAP
jgi:hypothetical protein